MLPKRGAITFVFDDGYTPVFKHVVPLLNEYKISGVFAVTIDPQSLQSESNIPITPWQDWLTIKSIGHEIAAHSLSHTDLTTLKGDKLVHELQEPAHLLNATTLIYPGGAANDHTMAATAKHYRAARTVNKGFESLSAPNRYHLKTYNFTKHNFSVSKANLLASYAWLTNSWLIETYHLVDTKPADILHSVQLEELRRHINYVSRLPISTVTIDSHIKQL